MKYEVSTVFKGVDLMSGTIDKMQRKARGFSHTLEGAFNNASIKLERMNSAIRGVTVSAAAWGAAYALPLANIYKAGADVEDQLVRAFNKLDEKVPLGSARFKELQEQIAATTKGTEVFQVQAAEAFQELAGAGYDAEKSLGSLVNVYDAARLSQMALGEQSVRIVDLMKMFNLEVPDATANTLAMRDALNMMAKADAMSTTNMTQLFEAIQNGGAQAAAAGLDLAGYLAVVASLGSAKGLEAGTGMKQTVNRLIPTEKTTQAIFTQLGVNYGDPKTGKLRDPILVLQELSDALGKMSEMNRAKAIKLIFGQEGIVPSIVMKKLKDLPGLIQETRRKLYEKEDRLLNYRLEQEKTGTGKWERFLKNFDDRKQKLYEPLKPKVIEAFDKAEAWMTANNDKIIGVMDKMINYLPDIADGVLAIAEHLPGLIKAVLLLRATELAAKGLRGGAGLWGMLFGSGKLGLPGTGGGIPGEVKGGATGLFPMLAKWAVKNPIGAAAAGAAVAAGGVLVGAKAMGLTDTEADREWRKTHDPRLEMGGPSAGRDFLRSLGMKTYEDLNPKVVSGVDNTSMGKDINIRVFTNEPRLKAEIMPAGFSPSSLLLPTSGGF